MACASLRTGSRPPRPEDLFLRIFMSDPRRRNGRFHRVPHQRPPRRAATRTRWAPSLCPRDVATRLAVRLGDERPMRVARRGVHRADPLASEMASMNLLWGRSTMMRDLPAHLPGSRHAETAPSTAVSQLASQEMLGDLPPAPACGFQVRNGAARRMTGRYGSSGEAPCD